MDRLKSELTLTHSNSSTPEKKQKKMITRFNILPAIKTSDQISIEDNSTPYKYKPSPFNTLGSGVAQSYDFSKTGNLKH